MSPAVMSICSREATLTQDLLLFPDFGMMVCSATSVFWWSWDFKFVQLFSLRVVVKTLKVFIMSRLIIEVHISLFSEFSYFRLQIIHSDA